MDSDLEQSPFFLEFGDGFLISNEFFWSPKGFLPVLAYGPLEEVKIKTVWSQDLGMFELVELG